MRSFLVKNVNIFRYLKLFFFGLGWKQNGGLLIPLFLKFNIIFLLQIQIDEGFPDKICNQCYILIDNYNSFKKTCEKSNEILYNRVNINVTTENIYECKEEEIFKIEVYKKDDIESIKENIYDQLNDPVKEEIYQILVPVENETVEKCNDIELEKNNKTCQYCDKEFKNDISYKRHLKIHVTKDEFVCQICGKTLRTNTALKRHSKIHSNIRNHICPICDKGYYEAGDLTKHMKRHRGEKPHLCTVCGKSFYESNVLNTHMRSHNGDKPHKCQMCEKTFATSSQLEVHIKTHTGEKDHVCDICGMSFALKWYLNVHKRRHTGERPYECQICQKKFSHGGTLKIHMRIHTGNNKTK